MGSMMSGMKDTMEENRMKSQEFMLETQRKQVSISCHPIVCKAHNSLRKICKTQRQDALYSTTVTLFFQWLCVDGETNSDAVDDA